MPEKTGPEIKKTPYLMYFSEIEDPRRTNKGNFHHQLSDILLLTITAMLCGVDDWPSVITFGKKRNRMFRKLYLPLFFSLTILQ